MGSINKAEVIRLSPEDMYDAVGRYHTILETYTVLEY